MTDNREHRLPSPGVLLAELTRELGLSDESQDWGIVNADGDRVEEFAAFLASHDLAPTQVFELIELIIASANERLLVDPDADLHCVDAALLSNPVPAAAHFDYWSNLEDSELYPIASWLRKRPHPGERS